MCGDIYNECICVHVIRITELVCIHGEYMYIWTYVPSFFQTHHFSVRGPDFESVEVASHYSYWVAVVSGLVTYKRAVSHALLIKWKSGLMGSIVSCQSGISRMIGDVIVHVYRAPNKSQRAINDCTVKQKTDSLS